MHGDLNLSTRGVTYELVETVLGGNLSHGPNTEYPQDLSSVTLPWNLSLHNTSLDTTTSVDEVSEEPYNTVEKILIGLILSLIIVFAIAGNILVIVAILTDRNLRKTSNYFIVSLAVADTLVASLVMTFAVANDILGYWIFGEVFCNIWMSFDVMCSTASILNLCAISMDRYIHIRSPLHYERRMTERRTLGALASLWVLSALISFLPIHLGWHRTEEEEDVLTANPSSISTPTLLTPPPTLSPSDRYSCMLALNPLYAVISSAVSFYAPCVVMVFIYVKLYQYARMHVKSIKRTWATGSSMAPVSPSGQPLEARQGQYKLQDHKAAVTLGVIMGTFLFCWVPFFTINIIGAFCSHCIPPIVFAIFTWLGYLNSTMNPVIYSIFNVEFREAFKRVLSINRCWSKICGKRDFEFGKPIRSNGMSPSIEYGAVNSGQSRKLSRAKLMSERITSV